MTCHCSPPSRPAPLYLAECSYGRLGREFQATDRDTNSRAEIVRQIRNGSIDPVKILEIDEVAGTCRDVTEELIEAAAEARGLMDRERDLKRDGVHGW